MGEDLTGRTLLGKYKVVELIGQGGMGTVWRATHVRTGRKLAIKLLDERFLSNSGIVQRFGREARAASAVQHPGIVEVLDLDQTAEGVPFLVMELLEGETLAQRLERLGRLSQDDVVVTMKQLLEALDAAHAHGVVHRDLKPDNIVLVPRVQGAGETVKILDFGISQKEDERVAQLTIAGSILGTPHYMAPEQAMGEGDVDPRADVYAAGVVMYECLVGDVPFDGPNYNRLIHIILTEEPVPPRKRGVRVDPALEDVCLMAMSKSREDRPQSAGELLQLLVSVTSGATVPFAHAIPGYTPDEPARQPARAAPAAPVGAGQAVTLAGESVSARSTPPRRGPADGPPFSPSSAPPRTTPSGLRAGASASSIPPASSSYDLDDLPDLDFAPVPVPSRHPSPPPPSATPSQRAPVPSLPSPSDSQPLSFDALDAANVDTSGIEVDEGALVRSTRPRRISGTMSSSGSIPAAASPSVGAERRRSYGQLAVTSVPPPAKAEAWHARIPRWLVYGAGGLLVLGGAIFGLRSLVRPGTPIESQPPSPVAVQAAEEDVEEAPTALRTVQIEVTNLPQGARLVLDGLPAHDTPLRLREGTRHRLEITAPGYLPRTVEFEAAEGMRIPGALEPEPTQPRGRRR